MDCQVGSGFVWDKISQKKRAMENGKTVIFVTVVKGAQKQYVIFLQIDERQNTVFRHIFGFFAILGSFHKRDVEKLKNH